MKVYQQTKTRLPDLDSETVNTSNEVEMPNNVVKPNNEALAGALKRLRERAQNLHNSHYTKHGSHSVKHSSW